MKHEQARFRLVEKTNASVERGLFLLLCTRLSLVFDALAIEGVSQIYHHVER